MVLLLMIVSGFILGGNAYALRFTGNAWLAHHYSAGVPTDEYFLVIEKSGLANAKLKGFVFKQEGIKPDFSDLTDEGYTFWQIDEKRSLKIRSLSKQGSRVFDRKMKKGKLEKDADKQAWVDWWVSEKLAEGKYKLTLWDENGKMMKSKKAVFAKFDNPTGGANPVPEPATMLFLGSLLIGLAAFGRKKILRKK